jgi:hypothetical protein
MAFEGGQRMERRIEAIKENEIVLCQLVTLLPVQLSRSLQFARVPLLLLLLLPSTMRVQGRDLSQRIQHRKQAQHI